MCGDTLGKVWDAATGFVEDTVETAGNFLVDNPWIIPIIAPISLPLTTTLIKASDFTPYDGEYEKGKDGLVKLDGLPAGYPKHDMLIAPGSYRYVTFEDVNNHMQGAERDVTPGHGPQWESIANALTQATRDYHVFLEGMKDSDDNWVGKSADAAKQNITSSFNQLDGASKGATAMVQIAPAFSKTIKTVVENIVDRAQGYFQALSKHPEHHDWIKNEYDGLARDVMSDYAQNISLISSSNPDMTGGTTAPQKPGSPAPTNTPTNYGGPSNSGGGGTPSKGSGAPNLSGLKKTDTPTFDPKKLQQQTTPQQTTPQSTTPNLPTDGLSDAANSAKDAASQAVDAAKQAMDQALGANNPNTSGLPEGVLGLGPKGLSGAAKGAGGGGPSSGGGSGSGARTSPLARNTGAATAATTKASSASTPAARSGISSGSGAPGAGAPAAGHRGAGAEGSAHKANKALRRKKNGEDVMGSAEAVVAVVGDEPAEAAELAARADK
jgi:hypothetical protein